MRLNYPEVLPISAHRDEIVEAIAKNQVVVVVGETGSGKSTQIPKMILEAFYQINKTDPTQARYKIACTQPRRIAAVSIATWMAQEMGVELGKEVGYKIRFDDETTSGTMINICTDGILLQEMKGDGLLSGYDAILVDEAHERNLNIDFLLGLLKDIQPKRLAKGLKEMKILVTSATVDASKFSEFFADLNLVDGQVLPIPIINVSGRLYPVDIFYKPLESREDIFKKIAGIIRGIERDKLGDVLIFLPGEAEIFATIEEIEHMTTEKVVCLPLYSRLPMAEQERIYGNFEGKMKVVVATNIAETSLTVPGIKYVIDSGLARMTDFNFRTGIGSLEVREISQASAIQRAGRAGRVEPGVCYRLYEEENFAEREKYTKPEILRSDLSSVVLHMRLIGIPDVTKFSFIDAPEPKAFRNAVVNLIELGAMKENMDLTELGVKMAHLPLEPRISAMLLAAERYDCVREVAIIASSLSVKDPFIRPNGEEDEADRAKRNFQRQATGAERKVRYITLRRGRKVIKKKVFEDSFTDVLASDLLVFLVVWNTIQALPEEQREGFCQSNYLNYLVIKEIAQIYEQLLDTLKTFAGDEFSEYLNQGGDDLIFPLDNRTGILKSISSGFIQNLCEATSKIVYKSRGVEGIMIHPGSALFSINPKWFVSAEIVETTKLYARNNTMIDPSWLEEIAPQLCQYKYAPAYFDRATGRLMREESVSFRGSRIIRSRVVDLAKEDPKLAQSIFIKEGLIEGELSRKYFWIAENFETLRLVKFYAKMLGLNLADFDRKRLERWYVQKFQQAGAVIMSQHDLEKLLKSKGPKYLLLTQQELLSAKQLQQLKDQYPEKLFLAGHEYTVEYVLERDEAMSGPVIKLLINDLENLNDQIVAKEVSKLKNLKLNFQVYNSDAHLNMIAESPKIAELKSEVDQWYLRKAWKKARRELEVKSFRADELWLHTADLMKRVEIGVSRFGGEMVYGYIGLRLDGKKIVKTLFTEAEVAQQQMLQVAQMVFKYLAKYNFAFKEKEIDSMEERWNKYFAEIDQQEVLNKYLWKELDLEAIKDWTALKKELDKRLEGLAEAKKRALQKLSKALSEIAELNKSGSSADLKKIAEAKSRIERGE